MKKQSRKLTQGNIINNIMGNNATEPKVGEGATIIMYSDRHAYEVVNVDADGKGCHIQKYHAVNQGGIGEQRWELESLEENGMYLRWRQGAWRTVSPSIVFTDDFVKEHGFSCVKALTPEQKAIIYPENALHPYPHAVIEGITRNKMSYHKQSIVFGSCDHHYDWSF